MNKRKIKHFESLFRDLQPGLFAFCCKYVEDKELARDFVQECFINLWENYESIESYKSYLYTSVKNRCLSYFRSLKAHAEYGDFILLRIKEIEIYPEIPDPLMEMYLTEMHTLIHNTVENLPEKCKLIFVMSRYQGLKNPEIAELLGISIRTVEAQIYNALKILRKGLKDYLPILI